MGRLFEPAYTVSEYGVRLGRLLGHFKALERSVGAATDAADSVHRIQRSSPRRDLEIIGESPADLEAIERRSRISVMKNAVLSGYRYLILGSTLGGKIIAKHLRASLGPEASLRLDVDESRCSQGHWTSFYREIEHAGVVGVDEICSTAVEIFDLCAERLSSTMMPSGGA